MRKLLAQRLVVQSELGHAADVGGLDEEIGRFQQLEKQVAAARIFEVASDASLASGVRGPVDRLVGSVDEERGDDSSR